MKDDMVRWFYMSTKRNKEKELIVTDPFGSYAGRPKDPDEKPIQDADDL